jgi:putative Mg2+ transporter-C (MgtC) family protein
MNNISLWEISLRLIASFLLTGMIGLERTSRDQVCGFRTHILVGLGSTLITLTSIYGFPENQAGTADPARLSAQIVSGIGFLGAGAIFRYGMSVQGVTTAASIWTAAGLGIACGTGFYPAAAITTFLVYFTLEPLKNFENWLENRRSTWKIQIHTTRNNACLLSLPYYLKQFPVLMKHAEISLTDHGEQVISLYLIKKIPSEELLELISQLQKIPGVQKVEF